MNIVVVGGKGLIGRALCNELSAHSIDLPEVDITNENRVRDWACQYWQDVGLVDVLINCACVRTENFYMPVIDFPLEEWNRAMNVNVTGAFLLTQGFLHYMSEGSCIINFSSIYGVKAPDPKLYEGVDFNTPLIYSVTKSAIIGMTRHLATELSPNIRVNCISPGGIYNGQPDNFVARYNEKTPLGRMAKVEDIVSAVKFLIENQYVTGQNIIVDGGFTL